MIDLINTLTEERGLNADLNDIDTSEITDMYMFYLTEFNGDISKWDVSNIMNIKDIFKNSPLEANPPEWYTMQFNKTLNKASI